MMMSAKIRRFSIVGCIVVSHGRANSSRLRWRRLDTLLWLMPLLGYNLSTGIATHQHFALRWIIRVRPNPRVKIVTTDWGVPRLELRHWLSRSRWGWQGRMTSGTRVIGMSQFGRCEWAQGWASKLGWGGGRRSFFGTRWRRDRWRSSVLSFTWRRRRGRWKGGWWRLGGRFWLRNIAQVAELQECQKRIVCDNRGGPQSQACRPGLCHKCLYLVLVLENPLLLPHKTYA